MVKEQKASSSSSSSLSTLFQEYQLSEEQRRICNAMKKRLRNKGTELDDDEEIIWAVAVETIDMVEDPTASDLKFYERKIEERLLRLDSAESEYGWFSLTWTKPVMRRLIQQWFCGMLVIDPKITTQQGHIIQFVREYYGDDSGYPGPEDQTDEWKKESTDLYALMARSICRSYPTSTTKGIVSFSDMQDFDWNKYDMGTKERHANIGSIIPNKLKRMIAFHPDEKMRKFYNDMTPSSRKKYGFEQYEDFASALEGESDLLPNAENLPVFVGGKYKPDIFECMKYLFRREPEALSLLLETHSEMEQAGEIPKPKHMEYNWKYPVRIQSFFKKKTARIPVQATI